MKPRPRWPAPASATSLSGQHSPALSSRDSSARLRILRGDVAGRARGDARLGRRFESVGEPQPGLHRLALAGGARHCTSSASRRRPDRLAAEELELARTWGAPRALGAALARSRADRGRRAAGSALLEEAVQCAERTRRRSSSTRRRAPSWEPRCGEPTAAPRPASSFGTRSSWRRSAARRRSPRAPSASSSRPAHARGESLVSGVDSLTPSERRVAEMAAEGPTNREIAQALFVTQRTVEVHLTSIYRKLAISSRSQLAMALAERLGA